MKAKKPSKPPVYNKLLQEQLDKHIGSKKVPAKYAKLLRTISKSYDAHYNFYKVQDRSIEWSSGEMMKLNGKLAKECIHSRKLESDIKTLFANTDTVFFSMDVLNYKWEQISEACEKVFGYNQEDFNANPLIWRLHAHPDDLYMFENHVKNLTNGERVFYEYRYIKKNGTLVWLEVKAIPELNTDGRLVRLIGIANDITERKAVEQQIKDAERLLNEAQQLANMGHWNGDMVKDELYVSDSLRKILDIGPVFRPSVSSFVPMLHPEDRGRVAEEIKTIMQKEGLLETSYRIVRSDDGQVRSLSSFIRSIADEKGKIVRLYGISQDITDSKDAELKIEKLNMLVYQISHDLRGPLNSAKNYIYLALKNVSDRTAQNYLSKIHDSYAKMEHRVLSLLDLQRVNRTELHIEKIDVCALIKNIIGSIDGIIGFNKVNISTDINIHELYSDKQFLHSIFHNLISNAINYRRPIDNSFIKIHATESADNIIITISDNGQGIPDAMKKNLFKKFVKGDTSTNGTGLGLYIVKKLANKLHGNIDCISQAESGTTFTLTLPRLLTTTN